MEREIEVLFREDGHNKPHKFIALLCGMVIVKRKEFIDGIVFFDREFKGEFNRFFTQYATFIDKNRPHTPFFHLRSSSFWVLKPNWGKEEELRTKTSVGGPNELLELIHHAEFSNEFLNHIKNEENYKNIEKLLTTILERINRENQFKTMNKMGADAINMCQDYNVFVGYLNSLQRVAGANDNALAESQACNEQFKNIFVEHPLAGHIYDELLHKKGNHVILTGHAGDGKTTLAVDVFKRLKGLPGHQTLQKPLETIEELQTPSVSIIKDLSERDPNKDSQLVDELNSRQKRFLIVSNTGTLLSLFNAHHAKFNLTQDEIENNVLTAISSERGESTLQLGQISFRVFNLARIDNLALAQKIFSKMLAEERWKHCLDKPCSESCPLYDNVKILQKYQARISDRIFTAYRRMYEYGIRLTIRQLTEHLAYIITSGLDSEDLAKMRQNHCRPRKTDFLFFNRFFGDSGRGDDLAAQKMKAVYEIRKQGFGNRPCPTWERKLWLNNRGQAFSLGIPECQNEFELLSKQGARSGQNSIPGLSSDQAREQVRRMLYFLYDFKPDEENYLTQYLNSANILRWQKWQNAGQELGTAEKATFDQRIYHVLQEHFTGVRLPEGQKQNDRRLYLTLNRRRSEIRQSAQVVLAEMSWSDSVELTLASRQNVSGGTRIDLVLHGKNTIEGLELQLTLPFLDYVVMRHFGELGEILQTAYLDRLERFKAQILARADASQDKILLVRLRTDNTFRRQQFAVRNNRLEVC